MKILVARCKWTRPVQLPVYFHFVKVSIRRYTFICRSASLTTYFHLQKCQSDDILSSAEVSVRRHHFICRRVSQAYFQLRGYTCICRRLSLKVQCMLASASVSVRNHTFICSSIIQNAYLHLTPAGASVKRHTFICRSVGQKPYFHLQERPSVGFFHLHTCQCKSVSQKVYFHLQECLLKSILSPTGVLVKRHTFVCCSTTQKIYFHLQTYHFCGNVSQKAYCHLQMCKSGDILASAGVWVRRYTCICMCVSEKALFQLQKY